MSPPIPEIIVSTVPSSQEDSGSKVRDFAPAPSQSSPSVEQLPPPNPYITNYAPLDSTLRFWAHVKGYLNDGDTFHKITPEFEKFLSGANAGPRGHNHKDFSNGDFIHPCPIKDCLHHHCKTVEQMVQRYQKMPYLPDDPFLHTFPAEDATAAQVKAWIMALYEVQHRTCSFARQANYHAAKKVDLTGAKLREVLGPGPVGTEEPFVDQMRRFGFDGAGARYMFKMVGRAKYVTNQDAKDARRREQYAALRTKALDILSTPFVWSGLISRE